jgi:hypothetical protein
MSGVIDPKLVLHHSDGPYLTAGKASEIALVALQCSLGRSTAADPTERCVEADVSFFQSYADFWAVEGGQTQFVGAWGRDREMFVVTIFGDLPLVTTDLAQTAPVYTPWRTFQIDATTGRILMTGGLPLPERFPGIKAFRPSSSPAPTRP